MEKQIYHYKDFKGWIPFSLTEKDGKLWNLFCQKLALTRPDEPNPYFSDYLMFMQELESNTPHRQ